MDLAWSCDEVHNSLANGFLLHVELVGESVFTWYAVQIRNDVFAINARGTVEYEFLFEQEFLRDW